MKDRFRFDAISSLAAPVRSSKPKQAVPVRSSPTASTSRQLESGPLLVVVLLFSCAMLVPRGAFAEAGVDDAGADDSSTEEDASDEAGASEVPLACDGGLCDTTVGSTTCAMPRGTIHGAPSAAAICVVLSVVLARRLQRRATEQGR